MEEISTVGLDLAKRVFQVHAANSSGAVVFRKRLRRGQVLPFFATLPPCTVAMEADRPDLCQAVREATKERCSGR
jgi:transposase